MVQLTLPLLDNTDNESGNLNQPDCDPSQSIYNNKSCIKDFLFCSDDNPCPSKIPCVDRVCQCEPNNKSYITLTPNPVRMYTLGCNFDKTRESDTCRDYEYQVGKTCLLNYCSKDVPCYAGRCDSKSNVCTNITASAARQPLPVSNNQVISLGDDPFGTHKEGLSPVLIIIMAAAAVVAIALIGCIVRTVTHWTKTSVAWASDKTGGSAAGDDDNNGDEKTNNRSMPFVKEVSNAGSNQSDSSIMRKPSKFTGSHYMPEHVVQSSSALSDISPFGTPVHSPHFSPYSHPDQGSDMSLSNPFRHRIDDSRISMDLLSSGSAGHIRDDHPMSELSSSPELNSIDKVDPVPVAPFLAPAHGPSSSSSSLSPPLGQDLRISRSQTFHRPPSSNLSPAIHNPLHQTEIRSAPLPFVGSRSPPPPPTMQSDRIVPPMMTYSQNNRMSSATVMAPSMSLDSLMDYSGNHPNHQRDSVVLYDSPHSSRPNSPALRPSGSLGSPLVIQSGAERLPSLTVPHRQSMLRHSASVPQLVDPSSAPPQAKRNLPAGFASNPVTAAPKRF
ncbi:hypothetical protein KI688_000544 [Linnemannia hyalina]|uniref:Uncharacterized protein n=1 Tax=Linnemannia hyalina TaxID=64524 RepID=A0A9P7Y6Z9_9FUNG|nr:hypothetical protein KI688_000544 [Linnemannia hyalina]